MEQTAKQPEPSMTSGGLLETTVHYSRQKYSRTTSPKLDMDSTDLPVLLPRTEVAGIFPIDDAIVRLASAKLNYQNDERSVQLVRTWCWNQSAAQAKIPSPIKQPWQADRTGPCRIVWQLMRSTTSLIRSISTPSSEKPRPQLQNYHPKGENCDFNSRQMSTVLPEKL